MSIASHAQAASYALVVYDYLISFPDEIETVWRRPFTATSLLHLSVRWNAMLVFLVTYTFPDNAKSDCNGIYTALNSLLFIAYLRPSFFAALRIYAIWGRNLPLGLLIFTLSSTTGAAYLYESIRSTYTYESWPIDACVQVSDVPAREYRICGCCAGPRRCTICLQLGYVRDAVTLSFNSLTIAAECLIVILVLLKTFSQWRQARTGGIHLSGTTCLLQDGVLCFIVTLATGILRSLRPLSADLSAVIGVPSVMLPLVLINRFIINLRSLGGAGPELSLPPVAAQTAHFSAVRFLLSRGRSFLGNIGEDLSFGEDDAGEECEEAVAALEEGPLPSTVEGFSALRQDDSGGSTSSASN